MKTTCVPLAAKSGRIEGRLDDSHVITDLSLKFENHFLNSGVCVTWDCRIDGWKSLVPDCHMESTYITVMILSNVSHNRSLKLSSHDAILNSCIMF